MPTEYVVLSGNLNTNDWHEIDRIQASGASAAQNAAYVKLGGTGTMRILVIPARSYVPIILGPKPIEKPPLQRSAWQPSPARVIE